MPSKIRSTPTVNAFLASLPQMLDYNFALGETLLLNTILVLQKLPFPPRYASSWQQSHTLMQESHLFQGCGFSLWYLEPSLRKNWLLATVVIFYKVMTEFDRISTTLNNCTIAQVRRRAIERPHLKVCIDHHALPFLVQHQRGHSHRRQGHRPRAYRAAHARRPRPHLRPLQPF